MYLFHAIILKITHLSRMHNPLTCFNNYANYAPPEKHRAHFTQEHLFKKMS